MVTVSWGDPEKGTYGDFQRILSDGKTNKILHTHDPLLMVIARSTDSELYENTEMIKTLHSGDRAIDKVGTCTPQSSVAQALLTRIFDLLR